jgi:hypothetical protein
MPHGRNKYLSREQRAHVRDLFMREWDPIGFLGLHAAADEYDNEVGKAYVMLMDEHATTAEIEAYLLTIVADLMGMTASSDLVERCARTATLLIELRPVFEREINRPN